MPLQWRETNSSTLMSTSDFQMNLGAEYDDIDDVKMHVKVEAALYTSQVNKKFERALTSTSVHACDETGLDEPQMRYPHRT